MAQDELLFDTTGLVYIFVGWASHTGYVKKRNHLSIQTVLGKTNPWKQWMERTQREQVSQNLSALWLWRDCHCIGKIPHTSLGQQAACQLLLLAPCHSQTTCLMNNVKETAGAVLSRAHKAFPNSILSLQGQGEHSSCFRGGCRCS